MKRLAPYSEIVSRRCALALFGATATLLGCGGGRGSSSTTTSSTPTSNGTTGGTLYAARGQNTSVTSFSQDGIFADGEPYQLCAMTENATTGGYDAALTIGIAL